MAKNTWSKRVSKSEVAKRASDRRRYNAERREEMFQRHFAILGILKQNNGKFPPGEQKRLAKFFELSPSVICRAMICLPIKILEKPHESNNRDIPNCFWICAIIGNADSASTICLAADHTAALHRSISILKKNYNRWRELLRGDSFMKIYHFRDIFVPIACFFLAGIVIYAPYEWGKGLVQEEISLQKLAPKDYEARKMTIGAIRQSFPVRERAWLWEYQSKKSA